MSVFARDSMSASARHKGFTLIELMLTLLVMAIVLTLAVPSFTGIIRNTRATTDVNTLVSALQLARSEAVKRGTEVSVTATDATSLASGYCVKLGGAGVACSAPDATPDNRLRVYDAIESDFNAVASEVVFNRMGELVSANALTISIAPYGCPTGKADALRQLQIGLGGQVTVSRGDCL
jgi:type IV fimbrial biogenesis protein FimT